jgi:Thioesterase domain
VMQLKAQTHNHFLPQRLYRGLLMLTCSWSGTRVDDGSLLIKVHEVNNTNKLPLIWCGGPPEMGTIISICGKDRTIYGLRGTYDFADATDVVIRSLSKYYADEIERAIPADTYLIAGYCAAAYMSIEVATILTNRGHKIGFLGMVDRDVSEKTRPLKIARKLFDWLDRLGAKGYAFFDEFKNRSLELNLFNIIKVLKIRISTKAPHIDPRDVIKYKKKAIEHLYELKPYPGKVSLFYIRWGVFGYYQLGFFRNYWRKIAKGGYTVDFVPGYSHKYPSWPHIIEMLHRRLTESGY